jgi:hypothetical protein
VQVQNLVLKRGDRRVVFDAAGVHRWASKDVSYIDLMIEGEQVGVMSAALQLSGQDVVRVQVHASFDLDDERHASDAELTVLDDRRALVSLPDAVGGQPTENRGYLSGSV